MPLLPSLQECRIISSDMATLVVREKRGLSVLSVSVVKLITLNRICTYKGSQRLH